MGGLLEANPQLREMLQNPEFLRQLSSPETMQVAQQQNSQACISFGFSSLNFFFFTCSNFSPSSDYFHHSLADNSQISMLSYSYSIAQHKPFLNLNLLLQYTLFKLEAYYCIYKNIINLIIFYVAFVPSLLFYSTECL